MNVGDIRTLYEYLFWAHERMMSSVSQLPPEELTRDMKSGHRSVRDTLVHMMSSEWIWLSRWHGISPTAMLDPKAFPTLEALDERWGRIRVDLQRFLGQIRDQDLLNPLVYRNIRGEDVTLPLLCSLQHLVNHNSYHRGQVATLLRQMGRDPMSTDLFLFYVEEEAMAESPRPRWQAMHAGIGPDPQEDED